MKSILTGLLLGITSASLWAGEGFRISEVVRQAGEGVEELVLKEEDREERLFVKKVAILDETDVKEAVVVAEDSPKVSVRLTEEGSRKMKAATERLRGERLAIVVDGRVLMAPVILATLEDSFVISGNLEVREAQNVARGIMWKPPLPPEAPDDPLPSPKAKTVPYSEEEYQARKAAREKMGIFYLEKVPSQAELDAALREGMSVEDVEKTFGRPWTGSDRLPLDQMAYEIAPEKRSGTSQIPSGFSVHFQNGKVTGWGYSYSTMPGEEKVVGREPGLLKMILPEEDVANEDFDFMRYFEGIKVPDPRQKVNRSDLEDLLTIALQMAAVAAVEPEGKNAATVSADCDLMLTLAHHFPEIALLREKAVEGRVRLDVLDRALKPYMTGGKPMPEPAADAKSAGDAAPPADAAPK